MFNTDTPSEEQIRDASADLIDEACKPFDNPELREILITIKKRNEQIIDIISKDRIILAGFDDSAKEKARTIIDTFKRFIEENKDELTAIELIYKKPYGRRRITYEEIKRLADSIQKPPYYLTTDLVWKAYEQLERSKVKKAGPQRLLTDIISLLRFTLGRTEVLEPFPEMVEERFKNWLREQQSSGKTFTQEQIEWLTMIKDHIATSCSIEIEDFDYAPFYEKGGLVRFHSLFGTESDIILEQLNEVLVG